MFSKYGVHCFFSKSNSAAITSIYDHDLLNSQGVFYELINVGILLSLVKFSGFYKFSLVKYNLWNSNSRKKLGEEIYIIFWPNIFFPQCIKYTEVF